MCKDRNYAQKVGLNLNECLENEWFGTSMSAYLFQNLECYAQKVGLGVVEAQINWITAIEW